MAEDYVVNQIVLCILTAAIAILVSFALFAVFSETVLCMTDTLLVCFIEAPERLLSTAKELHNRLAKFYGKQLQKGISDMEKRKK
jgi:hypothetical protein